MREKNQNSADAFATACSVRRMLDQDAKESIAGFVMSRMNKDGGFRGRTRSSDIYYSFFALSVLASLGAPVGASRISAFVRKFDGSSPGFIESYCLAGVHQLLAFVALPGKLRTLALKAGRLARTLAGKQAVNFVRRLEDFRSADGGYNQNAIASEHGSAYAALLACQAYDSVAMKIPDEEKIPASLLKLRASDGAFANQPGMEHGTTTATSAAATVMLRMGLEPEAKLAGWLLDQRLPCGGFRANPAAPVADILSTASAVFALKKMGHRFKKRRRTVEFIESHWDASGGFFGSVFDKDCDCEYTFYALLAIACLED